MSPAASVEPALAVRPVVTEADWEAARAIRHRVFVEEQACPPEVEWDAWDSAGARAGVPSPTGGPGACRHLLGFADGAPVAAARWRRVEAEGGPAAKLERFAVLPAWRGGGRGRALVSAALADARAAGFGRFALHAQAHLRPFYEGFGFRVAGPPFWEARIEHVKMTWDDFGPATAPVS